MFGPADIGDIASWLRLEQRRHALRHRLMGPRLAHQASWNILIDLRAAEIEGRTISVSSACIASGAPGSTGLRHVTSMIGTGHLERIADRRDRRRAYVGLAGDVRAPIDAYARRAYAKEPLPIDPPPHLPPLAPTDALAAIGHVLARVRA